MLVAKRVTLCAIVVAMAGLGLNAPVVTGQSAGDDQYSDPFSETRTGTTQTSTAPARTPAPAAPATSGTGAAGGGAVPDASAGRATLPRTGSDLLLPSIAGLLLLSAGVLLLRWRGPVRR